MNNPLLAFGIFLIAVAIAGGGLEALGFKVGPLASIRRQIMLFIFGLILIFFNADFSEIFPPHRTTQAFGPIKVLPGQTRNFPIKLGKKGPVDVVMESISPQGNSSAINGTPELYMRVCSGDEGSACEGRQAPEGGSTRRRLPEGSASIYIFNFGQNPPVIFSIKVTYPD